MDPQGQPADSGDLLLSRTWSAAASAVPSVRRAVFDACPDGMACTGELILMASEVATNAVKHAHTDFHVELRKRRDELLLTVSDEDPYRAPGPSPVATEPLAIHGRGLLILDQLSNDWGVEPTEHGKTVWLTVGLRSPAQV